MEKFNSFINKFFMSSSTAYFVSTLSIFQDGILGWSTLKYALIGVIVSLIIYAMTFVVTQRKPTKFELLGYVCGWVFMYISLILGTWFYLVSH